MAYLKFIIHIIRIYDKTGIEFKINQLINRERVII